MDDISDSFLFQLKKERIFITQIPILGTEKSCFPFHPAAAWTLSPTNIKAFIDTLLMPPLQFMLESKSPNVERYLDQTGGVIAELRYGKGDSAELSLFVNPLSSENPATISKAIQTIVAYLRTTKATKV